MTDTSAETVKQMAAAFERAAKWAVAMDGARRSAHDSLTAATLRALVAERDAAVEREAKLREAVVAFVAWLDAEDSPPNYGSLTRDTHPEGKLIWREWWNRNLRLCKTAQKLGHAALAEAPR